MRHPAKNYQRKGVAVIRPMTPNTHSLEIFAYLLSEGIYAQITANTGRDEVQITLFGVDVQRVKQRFPDVTGWYRDEIWKDAQAVLTIPKISLEPIN